MIIINNLYYCYCFSNEDVKCPVCDDFYRDEDEDEWYGCDICPKWWHKQCLPAVVLAKADLSCMDDSVFECPTCRSDNICQVSMVQGGHDFAICKVCCRSYHYDCMPEEHYNEYMNYKKINKAWYCPQCYFES